MIKLRRRAILLCEGYFSTPTAKTAHGLVRRSDSFDVVAVVDSSLAGRDAGHVLDGTPRGIPIVSGLEDALSVGGADVVIVGVATFGGYLPDEFRPSIMEAIRRGLGVVSGLHEYLGDDREFRELAAEKGVEVVDVRKPRSLRELRQFSNLAAGLPCVRIPVLGTDGAIGKRTTAWMLTDALNEAGVPAAFVATGQTGLLQGARYGCAIDAIRGDFVVGELEAQIHRAFVEGHPKVVVIEGQGSISHPAYVLGTRAILNASQPQAVLLQHAPGRKTRSFRRDVLSLPMPEVGDELRRIESYSTGRVAALTLNHEGLDRPTVDEIAARYEERFGIPVVDPLWHGMDRLVTTVRSML